MPDSELPKGGDPHESATGTVALKVPRKPKRGKGSKPVGGSAGSIWVDENDIIRKARAVLLEIRQKSDGTNKVLANKSGLEANRIKAILNPESQGTKHIYLAELRRIASYGLSVLQRDTLNSAAADAIRTVCNDLTLAIYSSLEAGGISPSEYAFISHLKIDHKKQREFSKKRAGVYANIRFSRIGRLSIGRMDLFPQAKGGVLCRFRTKRVSQGRGTTEQHVSGYIYEADDEAIHAIGSIDGTGLLRTSILKPASESSADLLGLRMAVSSFDSGPFASRLYVVRLPELELGRDDPNWDATFKSHVWDSAAQALVRTKIANIEAIAALLKEDSEPTVWGVAFPEGDLQADEPPVASRHAGAFE